MADDIQNWVPTSTGARLNPRYVLSVAPSADGGLEMVLVDGSHHIMATPEPQQQPASVPASVSAPRGVTGAVNEAATIYSQNIDSDLSYVAQGIRAVGPVLG